MPPQQNGMAWSDDPAICLYDPQRGLYCRGLGSATDVSAMIDEIEEAAIGSDAISPRDIERIMARQSRDASDLDENVPGMFQ